MKSSRMINEIQNINSKSTNLPTIKEIKCFIENNFHKWYNNKEGAVANYIPQLAKVNPDLFSISFCDLDGNVEEWGDKNNSFCIQSCSKPFSYCIAQTQRDDVHMHVGYEPSGRSFNAFTLNENGKPHNPMINSGAMVITSLIQPTKEPAERFEFIFDKFKECAGQNTHLGFENSTYLSEYANAHRNYALAYFMKEHGAFRGNEVSSDLESSMRLYLQMCSVEINTFSGARMACLLANHGVHPVTKKEIFTSHIVRNALSIMMSSGMYDYSGEFAFEMGFPAKSGVSGCIMACIPGIGGVCIWSPRLDHCGNSVRGLQVFKELIEHFQNIHVFNSFFQCRNE